MANLSMAKETTAKVNVQQYNQSQSIKLKSFGDLNDLKFASHTHTHWPQVVTKIFLQNRTQGTV